LTDAAGGQARRWILLLLALAATVYLFRLGATPLRINAEIRCHSIVRNMLGSGDYMMPRIDNREVFGRAGASLDGEESERVNKPPLYYWAACVASKLPGGFNLFAFRLPAVLAGLGLLLVGLAWSRRLGMGAAGIAAVALLSVSYAVVVHSRRGSFEMMLSFFSVAGLYAVWRTVEKPSWRTGIAAGACFALGFLTKATPILLVMVAPAAVWVVMQGRGRLLLRWQVIVVAFAALLAGLGWHLAIAATSAAGRERLVAEFLLPFGIRTLDKASALHQGPPYLYAKEIWKLFFPLSLFLPLTAFYIWRERFFPANSPWRLLFLAVVVPLVVFSLLPQKRDDYLLPIALPLALLTGRALGWAAPSLTGRWRFLFSAPAVIVSVGVILFGPVLAAAIHIVCDVPITVLGPLACVQAALGVLLFISFRRGRFGVALASGVAGLAMVWLAYFGMLRPIEDSFGSGRMFSSPDYDEARWEAKFEKYRIGDFDYLRRLLDVKHGRQRYDDGKV
jgi:4-amino-4-deoxy-L-arabinose transferase-like glycosyltransferase